MRQTQFRQVVILSAAREHLSAQENYDRSTDLCNALKELGITFDRAVGVYKDNVDTSFVCLPTQGQVFTLIDLGLEAYDQDSILIQNTNGNTYLLNRCWTPKMIGRLKVVTKVIAQKQESYTLLNDVYYVAS